MIRWVWLMKRRRSVDIRVPSAVWSTTLPRASMSCWTWFSSPSRAVSVELRLPASSKKSTRTLCATTVFRAWKVAADRAYSFHSSRP